MRVFIYDFKMKLQTTCNSNDYNLRLLAFLKYEIHAIPIILPLKISVAHDD